MTDIEKPKLVSCDYDIVINKSEFVIGRSKDASYIIRSLMVSKTQCIIQKKNEGWAICDKSTFGTFVNGVKVQKDVPVIILDGDLIQFGETDKFRYRFHGKLACSEPPKKKKKISKQKDSQENEVQQNRTEIKGENSEENTDSGEPLHGKRLLRSPVNKTEAFLEEKKKAQEPCSQKLQVADEVKRSDLELMQESKELQNKFWKEIAEKEKACANGLAIKLKALEDSNLKLQKYIKGELSEKRDFAEEVNQLQEELCKVRTDLTNVQRKKLYLEKKLAKTKKDKKTSLKDKEQFLKFCNTIMESELQCSICNEVFVTAVTLNCAHTFCKYCIGEWKSKKKNCPVCRTKITAENRAIALDHYIDKMFRELTDEIKEEREKIVNERKAQELPKSRRNGPLIPFRYRRELSDSSSSSSDELYE